MPPPIAIVGGGASGLLLARLLEIHNLEYIVYERSGPDNDPNLYGTLDCHPDTAQQALKEAGLFEEFSKVARFEAQTVGAFDHRGEEITSNVLDLPAIDWLDLRNLLITSIPASRIQWNAQVQQVEKGRITFEDGTVEQGFKLIVGADGVWSRVRHLITPVQPQYFGVSYLRTSISKDSPFWSTVQGQLKLTNYFSVGLRRQIVAQRNVAGTYTIYIGLRIPEDWYDPTMVDPGAFRTKLMETELAQYKSSVLNYVRHSDGEFHLWRHYTMPADSLCWDSVPGLALVGDAAHPTLPWPGEGMSTVLMDSLQLGRQIAKFGMEGLDQAVAEYEMVMFPRRREYILKCAELGDLFYRHDTAQAIGDLISISVQE